MDSHSAVSAAANALKGMEHEERVMTIRPDASLHTKSSLDSNLQFLPSFRPGEQPPQGVESTCSRCKKIFIQNGAKPFKTCDHCRELQRQRSRRWQLRTKEKDGVCTRCGTIIPDEQNQFVLCPSCRMSLRSKKASRGIQGKCVHCSGVLDQSRSKFKVCSRCRENDRHRRHNLEDNGYCIRCAKSLAHESGKSKICDLCRQRRNNPSLLPNARIPNILNAAYKQQQYIEQENQQLHKNGVHHNIRTNENERVGNENDPNDENDDGNNDDDDDDVLRAAQLIIPNYSSHNYESHLTNDSVSATLALVLTLADENSLLEGGYFTVDKN